MHTFNYNSFGPLCLQENFTKPPNCNPNAQCFLAVFSHLGTFCCVSSITEERADGSQLLKAALLRWDSSCLGHTDKCRTESSSSLLTPASL